MPAILRYDLISGVSITPIIMSFPSEQGLKAHLENSMPAAARNVDMWWEDASPRQQPTVTTYSLPTPFPAWTAETGKQPAITCPIEVVAAPAARRRSWANASAPRMGAGIVTGYTATQKAKAAV